MLRGTDRCPMGKFKGTKLIHVPKQALRDYLVNPTIGSLFPEFIAYCRTRFTAQENQAISDELLTNTGDRNLDSIEAINVESRLADALSRQLARNIDSALMGMMTPTTTASAIFNRLRVPRVETMTPGAAVFTDSSGNITTGRVTQGQSPVGHILSTEDNMATVALSSSQYAAITPISRGNVKATKPTIIKIDNSKKEALINNERLLEI